MLKCLLRLHETGQASGEVAVGGKSLADYSQRELAKVLAYVPQAGGWVPPFTVTEFVRLSRYPHEAGVRGTDADDEAVHKALVQTGMVPLAQRSLRALSGGERQKAYLAAALAQQTQALLLDEPASFLDPRHAADLHRLLAQLNREQGLTTVTVTHNLNYALAGGGQVLILRQGRQLYFGPAETLLEGDMLETAYDYQFTQVLNPRTGRIAVLAE